MESPSLIFDPEKWEVANVRATRFCADSKIEDPAELYRAVTGGEPERADHVLRGPQGEVKNATGIWEEVQQRLNIAAMAGRADATLSANDTKLPPDGQLFRIDSFNATRPLIVDFLSKFFSAAGPGKRIAVAVLYQSVRASRDEAYAGLSDILPDVKLPWDAASEFQLKVNYRGSAQISEKQSVSVNRFATFNATTFVIGGVNETGKMENRPPIHAIHLATDINSVAEQDLSRWEPGEILALALKLNELSEEILKSGHHP
jgi:hypothetical protein